MRRFGERVYGADRLLYPAVRKGPKGAGARFERVSWDEALSLDRDSYARGARNDGEANRSSRTPTAGRTACSRRTPATRRSFGGWALRGSRAPSARRPTGAANGALYGKMPSVTYEDYPEARLIIVWGVNPSASGIHMVPYLREAQRRGAKLVVIDPRTTPLAKNADLHLALRPGTDLPIALAIHRHLFEGGFADRAFLDAAHAQRRAAERESAAMDVRTRRGRSRRARGARRDAGRLVRDDVARADSLRVGTGTESQRRQLAAWRSWRCPPSAGKFCVRGGGYAMSNTEAWGIQRTWIGAPEPATRRVNMNQLGRVADRRRSARQGPVRLQLERSRDVAGSASDTARTRTGGPLHRRLRSGHDRHGPLCRRAAAGDDVPRRATTSRAPMDRSVFDWRDRSSRRSARRDRMLRSSVNCRACSA